MDKNCAIARDLMPQVIDNVASDESRTFVESHVGTCEPCTQVYADMKTEIQAAQTPDAAGEPVSFKAVMSQLQKTIGWKRIRTGALVALAIAVVLFAVYTGYYFLFLQGGHAMPNDDYQIHLFRSEDNTVYVIPKFFRNINSYGITTSFDTDNGTIIYLQWMAARIPTGSDIEPFWYPDYIMRLSLTDENALIFNDDITVQEIRQGAKNDYVVVYQAGDILPPLDPAVDEYIQQRDRFFSQMDAADEASDDAERMSFEAQSEYQKYLDTWEAAPQPVLTDTPAP